MPTTFTNREQLTAALEELRRQVLQRQHMEEVVSYTFAFVFGLTSAAVVISSLIWNKGSIKDTAVLPCVVALLMLGFRGSMAAVRRTQLQGLLLVLAFTKAVRPELAKPVDAVLRQIQPAPIVSKAQAPGAIHKSPIIHESTDEAYTRMVVKAKSLLPKCDLGPTARILFEEYLAEQRDREEAAE